MKNYVSLHTHSYNSHLDGVSSIPALLDKAQSNGMNALALTDHGNLCGALDLYRGCKERGMNPIIGCELYVAPKSRFLKEGAKSQKDACSHLTILAKNREGFQNLMRLSSKAFLEGYYYKGRVDTEILREHSKGLICLSGCVSSEFSRLILSEDMEGAKEKAAELQGIFGEGNFFIEVMNNGVDIQKTQMEGALDIAREMGIPVVATSDVHYASREDAGTQDVMLCVNTGRKLLDPTRMRMDNDQFYLRNREEMDAAFPGLEDAVSLTQDIADSIDIDLELGGRYFPVYTKDDPPGKLRDLCMAGVKWRYGDDPSEEVLDRVERELSVIKKLGFDNYFLIVWDLVQFANKNNIPNSARGSGVGSIVCYVLGISTVCPITHKLLFERFLDESRKEAPDIDIDICREKRPLIIEYVKEKYGEDCVAQIGTFGTMAAKSALKDCARVYGLPISRSAELTKMFPDDLGVTISDALKASPELKEAYDSEPITKEVIDMAMKLEGKPRNMGTHAAAVVISDGPITDYVPLCTVKGKGDAITQWDMSDVEDAGLLKMDFLGLRNLTILSKTMDLLSDKGVELDLENLPMDDRKTFRLLQRGETKGVFQLESPGIRDLLKRMKPTCFNDIIATNALYRPGPLNGGLVDDYIDVKGKKKEAEYAHPLLKEILEETHGVMIYQEDVMRIINGLGGVELSNAYTCIKAISKKKEEVIDSNREVFLRGCKRNGLDDSTAQEIWRMILEFAGYGFNKCVVGETEVPDPLTGKLNTVEDLYVLNTKGELGDRHVYAMNKKQKLVPRKIKDVVYNGYRKVYEVTTRLGHKIRATSNHPFYKLEGRESLWVNLAELKSGDAIAVMGGTNEVLGDEIVGVEYVGKEDIYDLEIEEDHNFVANNIIVHNSHSTAYALIAYKTAYLKAHHPTEFMAALLTCDIPGRNFERRDSLVEHIEDCERMGVKVLPPDVNKSSLGFTPAGKSKIYFGVAAIKGCRGLKEITNDYSDIYDFCRKTGVTKGVLEPLICGGAFDSLHPCRAQLHEVIGKAVKGGRGSLKDQERGQRLLFEDDDDNAESPAGIDLPDVDEWDEKVKLTKEREVLGMYMSSHPLNKYKGLMKPYTPICEAGGKGIIAGTISSITLGDTKSYRPNQPTRYATFTLEDTTGTMKCLCWPDAYRTLQHLIRDGIVVTVKGEESSRGGWVVDEIIEIEKSAAHYMDGILVTLEEGVDSWRDMLELNDKFVANPGTTHVAFDVVLRGGYKVRVRSKKCLVDATALEGVKYEILTGER